MTMMLLIQPATETGAAAAGIGAGALAFMLLSMAAVTALTVWCFYRVLTTRRHFDPDGTGPAQPPIAGEMEREKGL